MTNTSSVVTFATTDFERACGFGEVATKIDVLQTHINLLELKENTGDRDGARKALSGIKELLDEPDSTAFILEEKLCRTLIAVHRMIRANPIRLRYEDMNLSGYLKLLQKVKQRLFNRNADCYTERKMVAEEMSKLNLYPQIITERWQLRGTKAPNRAFMDMLFRIRPEFAKDDLLRREYTKLDNAWKQNDIEEMNIIRNKIAELGGKDWTEELED